MFKQNVPKEVTQVEELILQTDLNITFRLCKLNNADCNKQMIICHE